MTVKTSMSPLEGAVWGAEFVRLRGGDSDHGAVGPAIDAADQAVLELRDWFGAPYLTMSTLSTLECGAWAAEFVRVRAGKGQNAIEAALNDADRAVKDLREALGTQHLSLTLRKLSDDPAAQLAVFRAHLTGEDKP
jgi:hypothetical protein